MWKKLLASAAATAVLFAAPGAHAQSKELLNSSYDIARELFGAVNPKFQEYWKKEKGEDVTITQSHGGSSRQAQAILQGLKADVVTFNQVTDVDFLAQRNFVAKDWQQQLPNNASPYYSTIAFMVREGNPKNIKNWDDLVRDDVKLIFPNPKTSGNARYTYLGAWLYANEAFNGDEAKIKEFVGKLLGNVENFPTGGRGATVAFAQNNQGDVLLTFESEVQNIVNGDEFKSHKFEAVVPPVSVLAEFPVAVVDRVAKEKGTEELAKGYLDYLYTSEAQELLASFYYRVHDADVVKANAERFPEVRLLKVEDGIGAWDAVQKDHFGSGGVLDQLMAQGR
ncbi:sulfate ABC transporter substrate-binding protein [Verticiella sediminum]|uniref:Sulfate ABC transporter substrate-binding protein n=1 Tax=Verticiella sediminum TaxID=1247510 RepID=A0A556B092_9BURK|nr:thiosulfate ABC transporter substrate-binding protein CysP [Verticiella sediminum]TSH98601.1 sulfate ABC transporter substrate-binding protein [Verticiella sediminum]